MLALNDFLLKGAFPGMVTGKLSDFAGLIVLPVVIGTVLQRFGVRASRSIAVGSVGIWFSAIQLSTALSNAHERLLSVGLPWRPDNVADPADLLALPALLFALRILDRPEPIRLTHNHRLVILGIASLGCLASVGSDPSYTGPAEERDGSIVLAKHDSEVHAGVYEADVRSDDGGLTFVDLTYEDQDGISGQKLVCLPSDQSHCFRTGSTQFQFEESRNGGDTWSSSWANAKDNYLRSDSENVFGDSSYRQSLVVLADDTVFATTGVGPTLRWTPESGWTPNDRDYRTSEAGAARLALLVALFAILVSSLRVAINARWQASIASVLFLVAAASVTLMDSIAGFIAAGISGILGIPLLVLAVVATMMSAPPRIEGIRNTLLIFAPASLAVIAAYASWYFPPSMSIAVPFGVAALAVTLAFAMGIWRHRNVETRLPTAG